MCYNNNKNYTFSSLLMHLRITFKFTAKFPYNVKKKSLDNQL